MTFDADQVRSLMKAAVELDRHGTLPTDTAMELNGILCCDDCTQEMLDHAIENAI